MVLLTLLVVTVILDEMVTNAVAFLVCVVLVVVVISLTEWLAQQLVHARVPIYIVGLLTVAGLGWLVWTKLPLPVLEPFTFAVLLLVIIASIGYRHVMKLQHLAGTTEKANTGVGNLVLCASSGRRSRCGYTQRFFMGSIQWTRWEKRLPIFCYPS